MAEVAADDENGILLFDIRNLATEPGIQGVVVLVREIAAPDTVIDVAGTDIGRDPRQQVGFFPVIPGDASMPTLSAAAFLIASATVVSASSQSISRHSPAFLIRGMVRRSSL
jgi:hypothetical protein